VAVIRVVVIVPIVVIVVVIIVVVMAPPPVVAAVAAKAVKQIFQEAHDSSARERAVPVAKRRLGGVPRIRGAS
jgi:hypothetical protein